VCSVGFILIHGVSCDGPPWERHWHVGSKFGRALPVPTQYDTLCIESEDARDSSCAAMITVRLPVPVLGLTQA